MKRAKPLIHKSTHEKKLPIGSRHLQSKKLTTSTRFNEKLGT